MTLVACRVVVRPSTAKDCSADRSKTAQNRIVLRLIVVIVPMPSHTNLDEPKLPLRLFHGVSTTMQALLIHMRPQMMLPFPSRCCAGPQSRQAIFEQLSFVCRRLVTSRCLRMHEGKRVRAEARESLRQQGVWSRCGRTNHKLQIGVMYFDDKTFWPKHFLLVSSAGSAGSRSQTDPTPTDACCE
jgi:hypothetical protein